MKVSSIEFELPPNYSDETPNYPEELPRCKTCINNSEVQFGMMQLKKCFLVDRYVNEDDYCSWHEENILDEEVNE